MGNRLTRILATAGVVLCATGAAAQDAPPPPVDEHYGIGALGAIGWPGPLAAVRVSGPLAPRVGLDLDVGRGRESRTGTTALAAQVRWLRRERRADGTSDYAIFGVVLMDETTRTEIRFPGQTFITSERRKRLSPQIGYGFDWQSRGGTRLGLELAGGGAGEPEALAFRLFLRLFAVWGRPVREGA